MPRSLPLSFRHLATSLGVLAVSSGMAFAGPALEDGIAAYQQGKFEQSASIFQPLAQNGNATAQYLLSCQMINGAGLAANQQAGWEMLDQAAQGGHPDAEILQARRLEATQGSMHDIKVLYEDAARQGNAQALMWLGIDHLQNDRMDDAREQFENAWAAGDPRAGTMIATRFAKNRQEREDWLRKAAQHGETHAAAYLAKDYEKSDDKAQAMGWCAIASGLPGHEANVDWKEIGNAIAKNCARLDADMTPDARADNRNKVDQFLKSFFAEYEPWHPWRPCVVQ